MAFENETRLRAIQLDVKAKGSQNPLVWPLPKSGILAGIGIQIRGSVAGTLTSPNAQGMASIVRRIKLAANSVNDIINISGPQYHYLLRDQIGNNQDPVPYSNARSAVTATTFDDSVFLPIARNDRDLDGLIPLQHERFNAYLSVEFETDNPNVATGATVTAAAITPTMYVFDTPDDPKDWPNFDRLHMILGESLVVSGAGDVPYCLPTGDTFLQLLLGFGQGASPADNWSKVRLLAGQTDAIYEFIPGTLDIEYGRLKGLTRRLGTIPLDFMGTNGFGSYGGARDAIHMEDLTDVKVIVTTTGAGTLEIVKRTLAALK